MPEKLAVDGGRPAVTRPLPAWPVHEHRERDNLLAVLASDQWGSITGDRTEAFAAATGRRSSRR